jgi:hypothetical protein
VLAHLRVGGAAADVAVGYANTPDVQNYLQEAIEVASTGADVLRDLGEVFINWHSESPPPVRYLGLQVSELTASALTLNLDWTLLLPWPFARLQKDSATPSAAVDVPRTMYISPKESYIQEISSGNRDYLFITKGQIPQLKPGVFNHLILVSGDEAEAYNDRDQNTRVLITPRWSLPAGPF